MIKKFQNILIQNNIDFYYVCMGDDHNSEFIHPYFKTIEFLTGFTGSAGYLVITKDKAILWSDGRYFIQAKSK